MSSDSSSTLRSLAVAASLLMAAAGLCGCEAKETQLVVVTYTDLSVPSEMDTFELTAEGPSGMMASERASLAGPGAPDSPFTVGLYPTGDSLGPITVTARGLLGSTEVVAASARTAFVEGDSRVLTLFLSRACRAVSCGAGETCVNGTCGSNDVPAATLPPFTGELPEFDAGSGPMDSGAMDGGPTDGGVDSGARDSGAMDSGATDGSAMDSGAMDGSAVDSGADGGTDAGDADGGSLCDPSHTALPTAGPLDFTGLLTNTDPTFHRPSSGSICPSGTSGDDYAYDAFTFCNDGPTGDFDILLQGTEYDASLTLADPFLVVYDGDAVPSDPGACLAENDDAATMGSMVVVTLDPGQVITVTATAWCSVTDRETVCPTGGYGSYLLRVGPH